MKYKKKFRQFKNKLNRVIKKEKLASFYFQKGKDLLQTGKEKSALKVFNKGLTKYPNDYTIHNEMATFAMKKKQHDEATHHWNIILNSYKGELSSQFYLDFAQSLFLSNQIQRSIDILSLGLTVCEDNEKLISNLAEILMINKNRRTEVHTANYPELSAANKKLFSNFVNKAIRTQDWKEAIRRLENVNKVYKKSISMNIQIKLSMLYQVIGNMEKANTIFQHILDYYPKQIKNDKKGYRKITLFDNGESRIEFYKKLEKTDTVIVTFDSINMVWKNPSFAFNLLVKQNVDIIAIRKKRKSTYQQDLSLDDFYNTVNLLAEGYRDKIAYGFSLGAYGALYYASTLNCRILALSPRLSIHPVYGKTKMKGKFEFKHNENPKYNPKISPIIVYDPKNRLDNAYINKGLMPVFPNTRLVEVPYGGHGMGPHLKNMGVLKDFILTVINDVKTPVYNKELRKKSSTYYRVLADACLKRNKPNWALDLVNYALKLSPESNLCMRLKIHVLKKLQLFEDAIQFAEKSKEDVPSDRVIRLLLIDIYIDISNLSNAEREVKAAVGKFGETPALMKKVEQIQELNQFKSSFDE